MMKIKTKEDRIKGINRLFVQLNSEEQKVLLRELEKKMLMALAGKLDSDTIPNKLSMEEIVKEVKAVRAMRNAG